MADIADLCLDGWGLVLSRGLYPYGHAFPSDHRMASVTHRPGPVRYVTLTDGEHMPWPGPYPASTGPQQKGFAVTPRTASQDLREVFATWLQTELGSRSRER